MALNGSGERPEVHAVGSDADGAATAAGPERQDLAETVEQAGPLFGLDQPFELRPVGGEVRLGQPLAQVFQRLFLERVVGLDALKSLTGLGEQVHEGESGPWKMGRAASPPSEGLL